MEEIMWKFGKYLNASRFLKELYKYAGVSEFLMNPDEAVLYDVIEAIENKLDKKSLYWHRSMT